MWRIGATPCALPPTGTDLPYLNSLGDTAVDFDIAPPRVSKAAETNNDETINSINVSPITVLEYFIRICGWNLKLTIKYFLTFNSQESNLSIFNNTRTKEKTNPIEWPLVILRGDGSIYVALIGIDSEK